MPSKRRKTLENERGNLLRKVADIIDQGERNKNYGHPHDDYKCVTDMFNAYLWKAYDPEAGQCDMEHYLKPTDGIIFMCLVKIARIATSPTHEDNWADLAGYAGCGRDVAKMDYPVRIQSLGD